MASPYRPPSGVERKMAETRRVETGRMQFGNDWPGVFIRGGSTLCRLGKGGEFDDRSGIGNRPF
jgi:hypothetical protein